MNTTTINKSDKFFLKINSYNGIVNLLKHIEGLEVSIVKNNLLLNIILHIQIKQNDTKAFVSLKTNNEWEILGDFLILWDKSPKIRTCTIWEQEKLLNAILEALEESKKNN